MDPKETVKLKVDGREIEMPLEQVLATAQKNLAADTRLQEIAEMRKQLEEQLGNSRQAQSIMEDLNKVRGGDWDAMRRVMIATGNAPEDVDKTLEALRDVMLEPEFTSEKAPSPGKTTSGLTPEQLDVLLQQRLTQNPALKELTEFVNQFRAQGLSVKQAGAILSDGIRNQGAGMVRKNIQEVLDKHPLFGDLIKRGPDPAKTRDHVAAIVENTLARRLQVEKRNIRDSDFASAVEDTAKLIGTLPLRDADTDLALSLGRAVGDQTTVNYLKDAPKERPSLTDIDKSDQWAMKRLMELQQGPAEKAPDQ